MKKSSLILLVLFAHFSIKAQTSSIKVFTNLNEAKFKIYFQGELQNNFPVKEINFDSLNHKDLYKLRITFAQDTIADIKEEYYLLKDEHKILEIKKKPKIARKSSKLGRKVGKLLKIGNHDKEDILYDVFYLEDVTPSEYLND